MNNSLATQIEQLEDVPTSSFFFNYIDSIWQGVNTAPMHRFCTLMRKMHAASFVSETLVLNDELESERAMVQARLKTDIKLTAKRLTFFDKMPKSHSWDDSDLSNDNLLGYAIIVYLEADGKNVCTHMLEAVVKPPSIYNDNSFIPVTNYYIHNVRLFTTSVGDANNNRQFEITGSFFSQQNNLTSVCAHACLRMAINSSPFLKEFLKDDKLTNFKINELLKIDFSSKDKQVGKIPSDPQDSKSGLTNREMTRVIEALGFRVHSANFLENTNIEYDHFLYPSLESRCPTILFVEGWDVIGGRSIAHVVTVLGHTLNSDRWEPEARTGYGNYPIQPYISTSSWCDHFIICDDNYGMYVTLPTEVIRNYIVPSKNPRLHASAVVSIVPTEIQIPGYFVEQFAMSIARKLLEKVKLVQTNVWLERMQTPNLTCRTLLQRGVDYKKFIQGVNKQLSDKQLSDKQLQCLNALPEYVWISEISLPHIYAGNKHKLGDVVIRANATPQECLNGQGLAFAWFPGFVQLGSSPDAEQWPINSHVPLIRSSGPNIQEW
ncbi:MAG: hypothetical protein ABSE89_04475 [Sedimentisphaerales bacterium]